MASRYSRTRGQALHGFDLLGRDAAGVKVFGLHPVPHLLGIAAHQNVERAIAADEQQGQFTGLAVGIDAATADGRAVLADDFAQVGLVQSQMLAGIDQGFGQDAGLVDVWCDCEAHLRLLHPGQECV